MRARSIPAFAGQAASAAPCSKGRGAWCISPTGRPGYRRRLIAGPRVFGHREGDLMIGPWERGGEHRRTGGAQDAVRGAAAQARPALAATDGQTHDGAGPLFGEALGPITFDRGSSSRRGGWSTSRREPRPGSMIRGFRGGRARWRTSAAARRCDDRTRRRSDAPRLRAPQDDAQAMPGMPHPSRGVRPRHATPHLKPRRCRNQTRAGSPVGPRGTSISGSPS